MRAYALTNDAIKGWAQRKQLSLLENATLDQLALQHPSNNQIILRFIPRPDRNLYTLVVPLGFKISAENLPAVLEGISLANSSTFAGSWVVNHGKGEAYFRISIPTLGTGYTDQSLDFLVTIMFGTVEKLGPRLLKIAQEGADPKSILETED